MAAPAKMEPITHQIPRGSREIHSRREMVVEGAAGVLVAGLAAAAAVAVAEATVALASLLLLDLCLRLFPMVSLRVDSAE